MSMSFCIVFAAMFALMFARQLSTWHVCLRCGGRGEHRRDCPLKEDT
jgi:hypothetical protein